MWGSALLYDWPIMFSPLPPALSLNEKGGPCPHTCGLSVELRRLYSSSDKHSAQLESTRSSYSGLGPLSIPREKTNPVEKPIRSLLPTRIWDKVCGFRSSWCQEYYLFHLSEERLGTSLTVRASVFPVFFPLNAL